MHLLLKSPVETYKSFLLTGICTISSDVSIFQKTKQYPRHPNTYLQIFGVLGMFFGGPNTYQTSVSVFGSLADNFSDFAAVEVSFVSSGSGSFGLAYHLVIASCKHGSPFGPTRPSRKIWMVRFK